MVSSESSGRFRGALERFSPWTSRRNHECNGRLAVRETLRRNASTETFPPGVVTLGTARVRVACEASTTSCVPTAQVIGRANANLSRLRLTQSLQPSSVAWVPLAKVEERRRRRQRPGSRTFVQGRSGQLGPTDAVSDKPWPCDCGKSLECGACAFRVFAPPSNQQTDGFCFQNGLT